MPQFVRNGPDIPSRLLQLHEDGRVVFICGPRKKRLLMVLETPGAVGRVRESEGRYRLA